MRNEKLWLLTIEDLKNISNDVECDWAIIGDFNSFMTMEEREGGLSSPCTRDKIQFNNFVGIFTFMRLVFTIWNCLNLAIVPFRLSFKVGVIIPGIFKFLYNGGIRKSLGDILREKCILLRRLNMIASRRTLHDTYGDRNTKYFHGTDLTRRRKNTYESLQREEDTW
ncbi:hypothetical protein CR513_40833, partial [Mucuna pruriens]